MEVQRKSAMDTTAAGDIWNNTLGITGKPAAASAGNDSLFYTLPSVMDGLAVTASMSPGGSLLKILNIIWYFFHWC